MILRRVSIHQWLLIAVMLVAALYRARYFLQIEHNLDRAYPIWQALQTLDRGYWPLVGQGTSILFANPAGLGYMYIPLLGVSRSVLAPYVIVIALNTLGVFLTYRLGERLLGWRIGLISALLMAVNPWIIEYSRYSWPPALLPFFSPALAWLLWPIFTSRTNKSAKRLLIASILLALMTQTTLIAFFILLPLGLLVLIYRRFLPRSSLIIGMAAYLAIQVPYGIGLIQTWDTVQNEISEFTTESRVSSLRSDALQHAFRLVSGEDYEIQRGMDAPIRDQMIRRQISRFLCGIIALMLVSGIIIAIWKVISPAQRHERHIALTLLIWFISPIVAMSYNASPIHPYYQLVGLPAGHLLAAWGIYGLLGNRRWMLASLVLIPFAVVMGLNSVRHFQETAYSPGAHRLSALSLEWGIRLGSAIRLHLPQDGIVFADESEWIISSLAEKAINYRQEGRLPNIIVVPARGGLVVAAHAPDEDITLVPYAKRVDELLLPDRWVISIDAFEPDQMRRYIFPTPLAKGEKWLSLMDTQFHQEDDIVIVTSTWHVDAIGPELLSRNYAPFIHLFNANNERILIVDGRPIAGYEWEVGDLHIHQMRFALPEGDGPFHLMVGQYDSYLGENIIFILPDGSYTAQIPISSTISR